MESLSLRFLYHTMPGRLALKLLTRPGISRLAGRYLDSRASRWLIPRAARAWGVDMGEFEDADYRCFNAFFTRKRRSERMQIDTNPAHLISPCDGWLIALPIAADSRFSIKNSSYSVAELLGDAALAERFRGGLCLIFRLTPSNYHRYCYIDDGELLDTAAIPGVLHCVRPIACERYPVYVQNSREWALVRTEGFGDVAQVEIGALMVGRIVNERLDRGAHVQRGQEKGRFEFGGSTILALFERGRVELNGDLLARSQKGEETSVRMGETIGHAVAP